MFFVPFPFSTVRLLVSLFCFFLIYEKCLGQFNCPSLPPNGRCGPVCSSNARCNFPRKCICNLQCGRNCNFPPVSKCQIPHLEFGFATYASLTVGSSANFYCPDSYKLQGSTTRRCLSDLTWSGQPAKCVQALDFCRESPPALENGRFVFVFADNPSGVNAVQGLYWSVGNLMEYKCNEHYFLNDTRNPTWNCTESGEWVGNPLSCIPCISSPPGTGCNGRRCTDNTDCPSNEVCSCSRRSCGGRTCIRPYCMKPEAVDHGYVVGPAYSFVGDVVSYTCYDGYQLTGSPSQRTCLATGQWSGTAPQCTEKQSNPTCPDLPDITNGYIEYLYKQEIRSVAIYFCYPPFRLSGSSSRTCMPGGVWTSTEPQCVKTAEYCEDPVSVQNARYSLVASTTDQEISMQVDLLVGWAIGSRIQYKCDGGFSLNDTSNPVWTCTSNGTWIGNPLSCVPCLSVVGSRCGRKLCSGNADCYDEEVCSCTNRRCGGRTCILSLNGPDYSNVGETITYTCRNGYRLNPPFLTRTCQISRKWSDVGNTAGRCPLLTILHGSLAYSSGQTQGSVATYTCGAGFRLIGFASRFCLADGSWTGTKPTCAPYLGFCSSPPSISNGLYKVVSTGSSGGRGLNVGDVIEYNCHSNFQLNTKESRKTCLSDGSWSGPTLLCTRAMQCPTPVPILNGGVVWSGLETEDVAHYSCDSGYEILGKSKRECMVGSWSGVAPKCLRNVGHCNSPPSLNNGWFKLVGEAETNNLLPDAEVTHYRSGQVVQYGCRAGFQLNSAYVSRTCLKDGSWTENLVKCIATATRCQALRSIANGGVTWTGLNPGDVALYSCDSGYDIVGNKRECLHNGNWSGEPPKCVQNVGFCNSPPFLENGWFKELEKDTSTGNVLNSEVVHDEMRYRVGQVVEYGCVSGFRLSSSDPKKTCLQDGSWSGNSISCESGPLFCTELFVSTCPIPRPPRNGFLAICKSCPVSSLPGVTRSDVITYECASGYNLVGPSSRVCSQRSGRWSHHSPVCEFAGCTIPFVSNGFVPKVKWAPGSRLRIRCVEGFQLSHSTRVICESGGTWSTQLPTCVLKGNTTSQYKWIEVDLHLYHFHDQIMSWHEGVELCAAIGGWLATSGVRDLTTYENLKPYMQQGHSYWFGMTDVARESYWVWRKGEFLNEEMYDPALLEALGRLENDFVDDDSDCAFISNDVKRSWSDDHCKDGRHYPLCEKDKFNTWMPIGSGNEQLIISGQVGWLEALARCRSLGGWLILLEQEQILASMLESRVEQRRKRSARSYTRPITLTNPVCQRRISSKHGAIDKSNSNEVSHDDTIAIPCGKTCETNADCPLRKRCTCGGNCGYVCKPDMEAENNCCRREWERQQCGGATCATDKDCHRTKQCVCNGFCGPTCLRPPIQGKMVADEQPSITQISTPTTDVSWINFYDLYQRPSTPRTDSSASMASYTAESIFEETGANPAPVKNAPLSLEATTIIPPSSSQSAAVLPIVSNATVTSYVTTTMDIVTTMPAVNEDYARSTTKRVTPFSSKENINMVVSTTIATEVSDVNETLNIENPTMVTDPLAPSFGKTENGVSTNESVIMPAEKPNLALQDNQSKHNASLNSGCTPSPCENDCQCVESCKHSNGYFCKPTGDEAYLGRNCTHPPPYVECRNDSVMILKVGKSVVLEYNQNIMNGILYMDASGSASNPLSAFQVEERCQLFETDSDSDYFSIAFNLNECGTLPLFTGTNLVYINRIWWDRLTDSNLMSFVRPVAEVTCTYPAVYHVQTGVRPFCCDQVPKKTDSGTFLLRSALHKNPPGSGRARIPVHPDQQGIASYTVGEMIYLTVTLDLGPRMSFYSDEESKTLVPRFRSCWFSAELESDQPSDESLLIFPNAQPAFNVWGPANNSNVVDIGFEVIRWKNPELKLVYIHCLLEVFSNEREKRSLTDRNEYDDDTIIKGPIRIVNSNSRAMANSKEWNLLSVTSTPLLVAFVALLIIFMFAMFTIGKMNLCSCADEARAGSTDTLDFNMDGRY